MRRALPVLLMLAACSSGNDISSSSATGTLTGADGFPVGLVVEPIYREDDGGPSSQWVEYALVDVVASCMDLQIGYPDGGDPTSLDARTVRMVIYDPAGVQFGRAYATVNALDTSNIESDGGGLVDGGGFAYVQRFDGFADGGNGPIRVAIDGSATATMAGAGSFDVHLADADGGNVSELSGTFSGACPH